MTTPLPVPRGPVWYLEGFADDNRRLRRIPILKLPFRIGRRAGLELTLGSHLVSQRHAEIFEHGDGLGLRDLGSTNGTFHNLRRVEDDVALGEGDIVHVAQLEFRLGLGDGTSETQLVGSTVALDFELPEPAIDRSLKLRALLDRGAVTSVFQPIVTLDETRLVGYEVLGRGDLDGLPRRSSELFAIASAVGAEAELSRVLRNGSLADCERLPGRPLVFMNTHPAELGTRELEASLRELRRRAPELRVALEIHEGAVTDPPMIRSLREVLDELDIQLAFDDFGAGQTRLRELAEATPDFVKFDRSMVRDIDRAEPATRKLLGSLVEMARDLEIVPVAEGLEREAEATLCRELGFALGQGFLFGLPLPASSVRPDPQSGP